MELPNMISISAKIRNLPQIERYNTKIYIHRSQLESITQFCQKEQLELFCVTGTLATEGIINL